MLEVISMIRLHSRQDELWCEPFNLARRIPEDHPLRRLQEVLDLRGDVITGHARWL